MSLMAHEMQKAMRMFEHAFGSELQQKPHKRDIAISEHQQRALTRLARPPTRARCRRSPNARVCGGHSGTLTETETSKLLCDRGWKSAVRDVAKCKVHVIVTGIGNVNEKTIAHRDHKLSENLALFVHFFDQLTGIVRSRTIWGRMTCY